MSGNNHLPPMFGGGQQQYAPAPAPQEAAASLAAIFTGLGPAASVEEQQRHQAHLQMVANLLAAKIAAENGQMMQTNHQQPQPTGESSIFFAHHV